MPPKKRTAAEANPGPVLTVMSTLQLKKFKDSHGGKIGGERYNITKWTRKERAAKAFDKKDPLAQFSDAEIASGNLVLG